MKESSGPFIFASTLVRFIESEYHEPDERLRLIVIPPDGTVHEGCAGIDPLYSHLDSWVFQGRGYGTRKLRRVFGAVILALNPLSREQVTKILKIKPSLITANLRHLHSVLVPSEDSREIRVFHSRSQTSCKTPNIVPTRGSSFPFLYTVRMWHLDVWSY